MQISIELQYLHTSIQIRFALSEFDSSVFSVDTSPAIHQIHAIYIFCRHIFGILFLCGAAQCFNFFCDAVQCADITLAV